MELSLSLIFIPLGLGLLLGSAQAEQVCRDDIRAAAPDSRYQNNGNGTVTDLATGLIWKRCVEGLSGKGCATGSVDTFDWQAALQHAEAADFGGSDLWRLPNKNELASLVERRCHAPAINERFFPNTPTGKWLWSSSLRAEFHFDVWIVRFHYGEVYINGATGRGHVRLVRTGS